MYKSFRWTKVATKRNAILQQYEPIQPFLAVEFGRAICADTFVDIGANIGAYSIFFSLVPTVRKIVAFEPAPNTFAELTKNIELNGLSERIELYNVALSDAKKTVEFAIVSEFSGANSIVSTSIHGEEKIASRIAVECERLDDVLSGAGGNVFVKIDVEGHEPEVINGAMRFFKSNKCVVQLENYASEGVRADDVLAAIGYSKICVVGPDSYFTNIEAQTASAATLAIFEAAAANMIKESLLAVPESAMPIKVGPIGGVSVELSGGLARMARRARRALRATFGERRVAHR